ncbi:FUSC family protein [Acuticoccus kandeliae]|uniref:FUSC family protein n=1 Tax=Acuticoccus kandeliae TaxID=2073160 RepID=UPI000D3EA774|nr:FUSC family protein [Acuticoccus kandeliae]
MADTPPADPATPPFWFGDRLLARSLRFTFTAMAPLAAIIAIEPGTWLAYAILTGILGFLLDTGGPSRARLGAIGVAGAVVIAGTAIGTLAHGHGLAVMIVLAASGLLYGLVESIHPSAAFAGRFLCLSLAIGALYLPLEGQDVVAVALMVLYTWLVSVLWDTASGLWRPSTAPRWREVVDAVRASRLERWVFALIVAAIVALAYFVTGRLGLERANWSLLAIVIILRADPSQSVGMAASLLVGTLIGVAIGAAYAHAFPEPNALIFGMMIAALVRWPAQQFEGVFGMAAITVFIVLLLDFVAHHAGVTTHAPAERLIDIAIGCAFAVIALGLNQIAQGLIRRPQS